MSTTPKNVRKQCESSSKQASGKKLVQARLPFKILTTPSSAVSSDSPAVDGKETTKEVSVSEVRKRKLSDGNEDSELNQEGAILKRNSGSKENLLVSTKKKKTCEEIEGILILDDSSDDTRNEVDTSTKESKQNTTPKLSSKVKVKGSGTPNKSSATKLVIKLPLSGGAGKRRKSMRKSGQGSETANLNDIKQMDDEHAADSSGDIEMFAKDFKPQKREKIKEASNCTKEGSEMKIVEIVELKSENESELSVKEENFSKRGGSATEPENSVNRKKSIKRKRTQRLSPKNISSTEKSTKKIKKWKDDNSRGATLRKTKHEIFALKNENLKNMNEKSLIGKKTNKCEAEDSQVINVKSSENKQCEDEKQLVQTVEKSDSKIGISDSRETIGGTIEKKATEDVLAISLSSDLECEYKSPVSDRVKKSADDPNDVVIASIYSSSDSDEAIKEVQSNKLIVEKETSMSAAAKALHTPKGAQELTESNSVIKKSLTPKQLKLMEQRKKVRDEKERKLQEERKQKQREKEEKELCRKREREEKEEQRNKEREEKRREREEKRREREEKESKRLAEIEVKNEEKRKRTEAKEEELRKKEEERKRKEQEKEDAEMKKRKEIAAFTKFFVPKINRTITSDSKNAVVVSEHNEGKTGVLAFRPFQIKDDMKLAPLCRRILTSDARQTLDSYFLEKKCTSDDATREVEKHFPKTLLYLEELQSRSVLPYKWRRRTSTDSKHSKLDESDDVLIVEDELERAAQPIVEEHNVPVEHYRAKFFKFWENRRPPFYGTWRKKTTAITARRPFGQDKKYFDYEVDSDLEWEEEEPGESLEDCSDDDKEKESEDDDYEVDNEWFVPHGHLSEEEMQNEDEFGVGDANDNDREAQKAKLKLLQQEFAQEMKKKTEKIKPRLIGCVWVDENGNQPELCPRIIWETLNQRSMLCAVPPVLEELELPERSEPRSPSNSVAERTTDKVKPIVLSEKLLVDLVRLVHGNSHSKAFLIKEFIAYVEANEESIKNGELRPPHKSAVREKIDEFAEWQVTELNNSQNKKKKAKKRLCWIVSADVLKRMNVANISTNNAWQYTLQPKYTNTDVTDVKPADAKELQNATMTEPQNNTDKLELKSAENFEVVRSVQCRRSLEITKFTKVLTAEEKAKQMPAKQKSNTQNQSSMKASTAKSKAADRSEQVASKAVTNPVKKRVPLLMSVARGQHISQPAKNALIKKFLQSTADARIQLAKTTTATIDDVVDDDVMLID